MQKQLRLLDFVCVRLSACQATVHIVVVSRSSDV